MSDSDSSAPARLTADTSSLQSSPLEQPIGSPKQSSLPATADSQRSQPPVSESSLPSDTHISPTFPAHVPLEQEMTQIVRRRIIEEGPRTNPSSYIQEGVADTEMEGEPSQQSEVAGPSTSATKTKRPRTLTTPHQSAVLHALLAQSRFPTTAMREEVGRRIGLSARKVQIWFQNQRQKAKRPGTGEAGPSPSRPPQSEPSLDTLSSPAALGDHISSIQNRSPRTFRRAQSIQRSYHPSELETSFLEPGSQLLGPGMPGSDTRLDTSYRIRELPTRSPPAGHAQSIRNLRLLPYPNPRSQSPPELHPIIPWLSDHPRDYRALPADPPYARETFPAAAAGSFFPAFPHSPPSTMGMSEYSQPEPPSPFAYHPPDLSDPRLMPIQPSPSLHRPQHWDAPPLSSSSRRPSPPWSPGHNTESFFSQRIQERREHFSNRPTAEELPQRETPQREPPAATRSGRYDPVRGVFVPVPRAPSPPNQHTGSERQSKDDSHRDHTKSPPE